MPGGKVMVWVCLTFFVFILVLLALETDTRQALYMVPVWFVLLALGYRSVRRNKQEIENLACQAE